MSRFVIDENVPRVANDNVRRSAGLTALTPQADATCVLAAIKHLKSLVRSGVVVIDDEGRALDRYKSSLRASGQPGVGDAFLRHLLDRQYDRKKVMRLALEMKGDDYVVFPTGAGLEKFDHSDRLFVCLAKETDSVLINAVDSDYSEHKDALTAVGVHVHELCPQCLSIKNTVQSERSGEGGP